MNVLGDRKVWAASDDDAAAGETVGQRKVNNGINAGQELNVYMQSRSGNKPPARLIGMIAWFTAHDRGYAASNAPLFSGVVAPISACQLLSSNLGRLCNAKRIASTSHHSWTR